MTRCNNCGAWGSISLGAAKCSICGYDARADFYVSSGLLNAKEYIEAKNKLKKRRLEDKEFLNKLKKEHANGNNKNNNDCP